MVEPRILKGFRDYLPDEMLARQRMLQVLEGVFRNYGFLPLMTPALEYAEVLLGKYGDEGDSLLYRFLDNGERDVALRYDLTVPLARVVAQYGDLPRPFRRYQMAPVWRAEKPGRGRFREFMQCDGDIIGSEDCIADAEIMQLGADMIASLGVQNFSIRFNNRKVLTGLMASVGVAEGEAEMGVLRTIDKLPKIGEEKTRQLLRKDNSLDDAQIDPIFEFLTLDGSTRELITERLPSIFEDGSVGALGVQELRRVFDFLSAAGLDERVELDLSIARGLNYYTGTIYETFLTDLDGFGAVMSGGRYDGLIGVFTRNDVPGVGISLGIDRLLAGLRELDVLGDEGAPAAVLMTIFDESSLATSVSVATRLRGAGVGCELYPQVAKLKKQLKYAERVGKRFAVIVGPDEAEKGVAQLKDLKQRAQEEVALDGLADAIRDRL
jgi:histidyl-tRNA synthetase